jgi:hypothetical protein
MELKEKLISSFMAFSASMFMNFTMRTAALKTLRTKVSTKKEEV